MKRRLPPILMTLVLVCALPIWAAFVTSGDVTNPLVETAEATTPTLVDVSLPGELKQAIEAGSSVRLTADIDITETLVVTKSLTLDLNGFMLWLKSQNYGSVFRVNAGATLTLTDSGDGSRIYTFGKDNDGYWKYNVNGNTRFAGGLIAGGSAYLPDGDVNGGGVYVADGGTFIMEKGKIIGCRARNNGGGVYVADGGKFIMNGGEISDCKASSTGGGVCLISGAGFEMTGGIIRDCTADWRPESSAINIQPGTMKAHGGKVEGNVWVVDENNGITRETTKDDYTIFNGTITFKNGNTTAMYPVKFDLVQGSDNDITVRETKLGSPAEKPADPTKPNLVFQYWYEAGTDGSAAWDFSTPVTRPLHLLAKWEEKPQTGGYYYAPPAEQPIEAPKTADPGVALYAALSLLSLTGMVALNGKKR